MDHPIVTAFVNSLYEDADMTAHQCSRPSAFIRLASGTKLPIPGSWMPPSVLACLEVASTSETGAITYRSKPSSS
jgi:hypothetical protein